jgi:hypothetical protein
MANLFKHFEQIPASLKPHHPLPELAPLQNFDGQIFGDRDSIADAYFPAWTNQRLPSVLSHLPRQKNLDAAGAKKPRGKNLRIVEHQTIAFMHIGWEVAKHAILERAPGAIDHQHARAVAFAKRLLRNQFFGEVVIKFVDTHSSRLKEDADPRHRIFVR